ncbi:MAG: hypothetical protein M0P39_09985 [Rhodocyclaceae bacterium]|jgi:hypothetical protein|nr:hypothetical protein [Rhodocyclaceae bacterium]
MYRKALMATLPTPDEFSGFSAQRKKQTVEQFIAAILDAIEAERRPPDAWESQDLAAALGLLAMRMYVASIGYASRALESTENRTPIHEGAGTEVAQLGQLRDGLATVAALTASNR